MGALKIKADFNMRAISDYMDKEIKRYIDSVKQAYIKAGTAMVEDARSRTKDLGAADGGSFGNITWNLRSSIGCAVYIDGVNVYRYFPVLSTGAEGAQRGSDYADELNEGVEGLQLIVVAGMDYAAAVESKGYNVITATSIAAEGILEGYLNAA